jgi:Flp pilus assembly pilin Flp
MLRSKTAKAAACARRDGQGPFTIEYSLIASGIACGILAAIGVIGNTLGSGLFY